MINSTAFQFFSPIVFFLQDRLMKDDGMDDMGGYGDHMGGGSRWGRNDGYSGGGSSWRGADQWGTSRGGAGARGAGQHWGE